MREKEADSRGNGPSAFAPLSTRHGLAKHRCGRGGGPGVCRSTAAVGTTGGNRSRAVVAVHGRRARRARRVELFPLASEDSRLSAPPNGCRCQPRPRHDCARLSQSRHHARTSGTIRSRRQSLRIVRRDRPPISAGPVPPWAWRTSMPNATTKPSRRSGTRGRKAGAHRYHSYARARVAER